METNSTDNKQDKALNILRYYFESELDHTTVEKVQDWFSDGHDREEKDKALEKIWQSQVKYDPNPDKYAYSSLEQIRKLLGFESRNYKSISLYRRNYFRIAAVLLPIIILAGSIYLYNYPGKTSPEVSASAEQILVLTAEKSMRHIELPDGSEIWLNTNGKISYPENFSDKKTVYLDGEGFFSVAEQIGAPFVVQGKNFEIKVLGTEFSVKSYDADEETEIQLASGSIEAIIGERSIRMAPLQQLNFNSSAEQAILTEVSQGEIAQWREVNLNFNNIRLDKVFERIGQYFGVNVSVDNKLDLNKTLRVNIDKNESLDEVLFIIQNTLRSFDYEINGNEVTITAK